MADLAMKLCTDVVTSAVPIAFAFGITNIVVRFFMRTAFGGAMRFD